MRHPSIAACLVVVGFVLAVAGAAGSGQSGTAYGWPVKPFDRQHAVRGALGDPRTLFWGSPTWEVIEHEDGKFNLHTGVDISAVDGTPVYPVVDGRVQATCGSKSRKWVVVGAADGRVFEYWHIMPRVHVGQQVTARRTVLGVVAELNHVHLAELSGGTALNPLAPGHLVPYADSTRPKITRIGFEADLAGTPAFSSALHGRVVLVAAAYDMPPLSVSGIWHDMPITPAKVTWSIRRWPGEIVVPEHVAVDVRNGFSTSTSFWSVYARGTYQNMAVFGKHYSYGQPGVYLFNLAHGMFDTRRLRNGVYDLVVTATDTRGNTDTRSQRFNVENGSDDFAP